MSLSLRKLVNAFPASPHAPSAWGREGARPGEMTAGIPAVRHRRAGRSPFSILLKPTPHSQRLSAAPAGRAAGQDSSQCPAGGRSRQTCCSRRSQAWSQASTAPSTVPVVVSPAPPSPGAAPGVPCLILPNTSKSWGRLQGCSKHQRTRMRRLLPASVDTGMCQTVPTRPPAPSPFLLQPFPSHRSTQAEQ